MGAEPKLAPGLVTFCRFAGNFALSLSETQTELQKDDAPLWFGFAFSFALFARDPRAPHPPRPRKFCKKYRQGTIEATFERKRDTRDFARFCACFATALPKIPSLAIFRDFFVF